MFIGLFINMQNCEAAYYCKCITEENGDHYKYRKLQVTSFSVNPDDHQACIKYCKKAKPTGREGGHIGAMHPSICKDKLCEKSRDNITMY
jgi:hypothetical protein